MQVLILLLTLRKNCGILIKMEPYKLGRDGEWAVYHLLKDGYKRTVHRALDSAHDFLVDEKYTIDVKTASARNVRGMLTWCFNIHRRGVLPSNPPWGYVLRLENVPAGTENYSLHFLFRNVTSKTISISLRSLLAQRYGEEFAEFRRFAKGQPRALAGGRGL